ncbi:amidohydrolase [Paenibacillus antibioticophila]|uniref:Amidohydrolase n=1 Tax=Paenibacillus antibioticophila TaxID=1274374 RepID=A0A919XT05_9BACL|nr:amidohydrolase family protein [Paenibacillus antibioticophila]GIO38657.1 amidohydrolase [Paenibacillus antibioticophila]
MKLLKNCVLIDGVSSEPVDRAYILIDGEEIVEIGRGDYPSTSSVEVIDCQGAYVLPGLIDAHVHLIWDGSSHPQSVIAGADPEIIALRAYRHALKTLALGITSVRDLASPFRTVLQVRNAINSKLLVGPSIVASGPSISMTGGHIHYIGVEADGEDEVRKASRSLLKQGADVIKVMATGGIYTQGEEPGSEQMTVTELRAAREEASKKNKKTAAHAQGRQGIINCLDAGIETIEHGIYADRDVLIRMKEQGTYLVPTMIVFRNLASDSAIPPWAYQKVQSVLEPHYAMLEQAISLKLNIATGTDCGSPATPPEFYFDELIIMQEAGMTPMEVIHASTRVAAECIDLHDRGTIEVGKKADLLIVEENPLQDLNVLRGYKQVVKNGQWVSEKLLLP